MDELTLDDQKYLSSKQAAKVTGYAKDYVGQLCREGRVNARLVGRNWYVLESSILEHRFGAEDETGKETQPEIVPEAPVSSWEAPTYSAEPVRTVPELAPKPLPDTKRALADMQSAWQEWFQTQEKALPEPSEMLLSDHVEISAPISIEEEAQTSPEPLYASQEHFITEEEEGAPVHLERVREAYIEPEREEVVEIRPRIVHHVREEPEEVAPVRIRQQQRPTQAFKKIGHSRIRRAGGSSILRAVFLSVAGLAIVVAIIGSGALDKFTSAAGAASFLANTLSGINEIDK